MTDPDTHVELWKFPDQGEGHSPMATGGCRGAARADQAEQV
jgi:hypothetical protein